MCTVARRVVGIRCMRVANLRFVATADPEDPLRTGSQVRKLGLVVSSRFLAFVNAPPICSSKNMSCSKCGMHSPSKTDYSHAYF